LNKFLLAATAAVERRFRAQLDQFIFHIFPQNLKQQQHQIIQCYLNDFSFYQAKRSAKHIARSTTNE